MFSISKSNNNLSPFLSVVTPVYGCRTSLYELYYRLKETLETINSNFEIIMVNDDSPDKAWDAILELAKKDNRIKGINLSRNFGQHYAITAGLEHAQGEWVVVMDCDLQDQPEEIIKLYNKALEGLEIVLGKRENRQDNFFKKTFSKWFYKVLSYLTGTKQDASIANFGIYHKKVISAICSMEDNLRYFPTMVKWVGFKSTTIFVEHAERSKGKSTYSYRKLINLSLDVMLAFSDKPLKLTVKFGLIISFFSIIFGIYNLIKFINGDIIVLGWISLILSIWFLSGMIIFVLGIVGLYVGKTFEKVKNRPKYIISDLINI